MKSAGRRWLAIVAGVVMTCLAGGVVGARAQKANKSESRSEKKAAEAGTMAAPESVGISSERLERLHALMEQAVDKKEVAGAVTLLARHGKIVDYRTYG